MTLTNQKTQPRKVATARRSASAFTLIELLIVIAIIAILAAILLPVFAQAREKARQASCISNLKQIGIAFLAYSQDNDEFIPPQTGSSNELNCMQVLLQPYIKSRNVFYCPDRFNFGCSKAVDPSGVCVGYAPNYGINSYYAGMGLYYPPAGITGAPANATSNVWNGHQQADFNSPSQTILAGDSNDTNTLTLTSYFQTGDGKTSSAIRHGGFYNFAFVDGHVKSMLMGAYSLAADSDPFTIMPQDPNNLALYCRDVNAVDHYGYGSGTSCGAVAALIAANRVAIP